VVVSWIIETLSLALICVLNSKNVAEENHIVPQNDFCWSKLQTYPKSQRVV
uniref:Uncharacterized protein n=1 Tax=Anopheles minimus TaxID=112268 RepID=A0A182WMN8_9DIPT